MKKVLILILCLSTVLSCKNDKKDQNEITADGPEKTAKQSDGLTLLKGEFVYYGDAAVLHTHSNIYGVFVTDKMHELDKLAQQYKTQPTDMVKVEIRGKITDKKDEKILWEQKVEIVEILNVSKSKENNVVKIESE